MLNPPIVARAGPLPIVVNPLAVVELVLVPFDIAEPAVRGTRKLPIVALDTPLPTLVKPVPAVELVPPRRSVVCVPVAVPPLTVAVERGT